MRSPDDRHPTEAPPGPADDLAARFSRMLGRDVLSYIPSVAVPALSSLAFVIIFTRVFDPEAFGRYSVVFVTCTILTNLCAGWMSQSVIRYLPRYRADDDVTTFKSMLAALLVLVLAVLALAFALAWPLARGPLGAYRGFYLPGAVMVTAGVGYQALRALFQANLQSRAYARAEVLYALGRIGLALVFVFGVSRSAVGLIAGPAVSYAVLFLAMIPWQGIVSAVRARRGAFRLTLAPAFLRYGFPMIGWMVGVKVLELSDRYIIEWLRGSAEVGVYSANYGIASMGIWIVATPVLLAAHPLIFNAWESGERPRIQRIVSTFSRYYLLGAIPMAVYAGVFARDLSAFLLGESFRGGYPVVTVVFAGLLVWNFGFYGHKAIKLLEKTSLMFALVVVCALANIALNFVLVPSYGYMGAAVATLISAALYPIMVYFVTRRYLPWVIPWASIVRVLAAAAVAGGAAWLAALVSALPLLRLVTGGVAGVVAYAAMLLAFRELRSDEVAVLRRLGGEGEAMTGRGFREVDHSGDVGVEAWGATPREALEEATKGLFSLLVRGGVDAVVERVIEASAGDDAALVVEWLGEVILAGATHAEVYSRVRVDSCDGRTARGVVSGEAIDPSRHRLRFDVKAATYHGLRYEETPLGVRAVVVFDL